MPVVRARIERTSIQSEILGVLSGAIQTLTRLQIANQVAARYRDAVKDRERFGRAIYGLRKAGHVIETTRSRELPWGPAEYRLVSKAAGR